jgi:hypothetical protein
MTPGAALSKASGVAGLALISLMGCRRGTILILTN